MTPDPRSPAEAPTPGALPEPRHAPVGMTPDAFRAVGHALIDEIASFLEGIPHRPVTPGESLHEVQALIDATRGVPEDGTDPADLLISTARLLIDHSLFNGHPRFFGYVTSAPAPIGMLADLLAAAVNPNVGAWRLAPIATEIEAQTVRWIAEMIGYGTDGGGLFVSGGNLANIVGLLAARTAAANWDVRSMGVCAADAKKLRIYASRETHTWLQKAADLSGLGTDAIRWLPVDGELRMEVSALRDAVRNDRAAGDIPMIVVGTAGTVGTGSIDPLSDIAAVCADENIWFHVDGAYGALAAVVPDAPGDLRALHLADSLAVDPHKWLYAPLEAGCVLVRDPATLRNTFSYHPPYYHFGEEVTNFVDYGPQNSRGFKALKVWLALQQVGRRGYASRIAEDIRLSRLLHDAVAAESELEVVTQGLSISTFRFVPVDLRPRSGVPEIADYIDRLNRELLERIQLSGDAFISNAVVNGTYVLRACIVNFRTGEEDIRSLPRLVLRLGRDVDTSLRPDGRA